MFTNDDMNYPLFLSAYESLIFGLCDYSLIYNRADFRLGHIYMNISKSRMKLAFYHLVIICVHLVSSTDFECDLNQIESKILKKLQPQIATDKQKMEFLEHTVKKQDLQIGVLLRYLEELGGIPVFPMVDKWNETAGTMTERRSSLDNAPEIKQEENHQLRE